MTDAELPVPPVPQDVDLRDFPYTPVYRARLFGSSFHARVTDSEWRAGVTLWLKSWEQVPAGSLPDDDIELCRLAELGRDLRTWRKLRQGALHGWFRCSDGRFYHLTVAEGVLEAHSKRATAIRKGKAGALKRWGRANATAIAGAMPGDSNLNRREENRREVGSDARAREPPSADQGDAERWAQFQAFKTAYPLGTYGDNVWQNAERNFRRLIDDGESPDRLLEGARAYKAQQQSIGKVGTQYVKHPDKFLSEGKWRGPFPIPLTPESAAQARRDAKLEASWSRVKTHAAAIGCPLQPYPVDSPDSFEGRVRSWELNGASQRTSGLKSVASLLPAKGES